MYKIAFIGQQCAGKTTAAKAAAYLLQSEKPVLLKFAGPIYMALSALQQEKNRAFMQEFSDLAKKHFGDDIFVRCAQQWTQHFDEMPEEHQPSLCVCDDCRYMRELEALKAHNYTLIYIDASADLRKARADELGLAFVENHSSEMEVPSLREYCDAVVTNNGEEQDVLDGVKTALEQLGYDIPGIFDAS